MKAADVMVHNVVTVAPDTSVQAVAKTLIDHRISAVPVVDASGALVGIVSEGDLMRRPEAGTERRHSWWLRLLTSDEILAEEFARSHARRVGDVMTRQVITAGPAASLREIADLLEKHAIKRVPIVEGGKLLGIVSRANLLQALASLGDTSAAAATPDDVALRDQVIETLESKPWAHTSLVSVIARNGTIDLWGIVDSLAEKKALRVAAEATPGVRGVNDRLSVRSTYGR